MTKTELKSFLLERYNDGSKHSIYQNIPSFIEAELQLNPKLDNLWRSDTPRWDCLKEFFKENPFSNVADVGANTGYFSFNFAKEFPVSKVTALELNENHADFIKKLADYFEVRNVHSKCAKITLENVKNFPVHDIILYMNIAHHIGHDFNPEVADKNTINKDIENILSGLSKKCTWMVFQMGYNWGGDKQKPIIDLNDDLKKIRWTKKLFDNSGFDVLRAYMATRNGEAMEYKSININEPDEKLQARLNELKIQQNSEFFRRPFFILRTQGRGRK